jgi:virulence-associated protein VagC
MHLHRIKVAGVEMSARVVTKVFMNGGSQAVRIPAEMRFDTDEVIVSFDRETRAVTIRPISADERKAAFLQSMRSASSAERAELENSFGLKKDYSVPQIDVKVSEFFLGQEN